MRRRLLLVVLATTTLVVVAFAVPLAALVRSVARDRAISSAERDAAALAPVLAITTDPSAVRSALEGTALGAAGRLTVVLPDGTKIGETAPIDPSALALAQDRQRAFSIEDDRGLASYAPVITGAGAVSVLRARIPASELDEGVAGAWLALAAVALGLVVAAAVVADRLARGLTEEAVAMAATARSLAGGDATARVTPGSTPELVEAAGALNLLADRIDALRTAERERVADLSHRLRTPLTALRLDADRAGDAGVSAGVDRLEAAVSELVRSARRPLHDSPVSVHCDLTAVVTERLAFWSALADDDGRSWTADVAAGPLPVALGDEELAAVVDALIGNVFAHTPDGASYRIDVAVEGAEVRLVVEDGGAGIADPATVLERGRTDAGSTGLGLDIARQAAEAAGGSLRIGEAAALDGARIELRIPVFASS